VTRRVLDPPGRSASRRPFKLLLGVCTLSTCGYSLLLSVVPLWVSTGGSGAFGAGVSTGVFMLTTVLTQLGVPWLLRRFGYRVVLAVGLGLLGAPAPLLALSAELPPVLLLSALRGIGFGLFTVASGALVAELVPPAEHGRSTALFGLATGIPQLLLLPTGVGVVQHFGFAAVLVVAAVPLLGLPLLPFMRTASARRSDPAPSPPEPGTPLDPLVPPELVPPPVPSRSPSPSASPLPPGGPIARRRPGPAGPVLAMLSCATAQGALITFLPLAVAAPGLVVPVALFGTAGGALLGRVVAGDLVDRRGMGGRLLGPGVLVAVVGMFAEVLVAPAPAVGGAILLAAGAVLVGFGFGLVQNDSLVALFAAAGAARYGRASALWNIAYDAGTGAGAVGLGAVAELFGFRVTFAAAALLLVLVLPFARAGSRRRGDPVGG
jgi:MFS family permease